MKFLKWIGIVFGVLILSALMTYMINEHKNKTVELTQYTFTHEEVPKAFDGFKFLIISDLHEAPFTKQITSYINREKPDAIIFLGDMVQLPGNTIEKTVEIARSVTDIPMYGISGNHETQCGAYKEIIQEMWHNNIIPLDNDSVSIKRGLDSILLLGAKDPESDNVSDEQIDEMREQIEKQFPDGPCFSVLLMHRASLYPEIKDTGADLIFSGDLHGGIIRLPFMGGLIGKKHEKNFFPEYEYGFFKEGDSSAMIVSGGCDMNPEKKRFFNPPEVVLVTLKKKD